MMQKYIQTITATPNIPRLIQVVPMPTLSTILGAVWIVDGVAGVESSGKAVELEMHACNLAIAVHGEDVNALDGVRCATKAGGDPFPYHCC